MSRHQATDLTSVRENNLGLVLNLIRQAGAISRADLVRQTNLSATTISALANVLLESGFVRETGMGESSGGRPPILLEFDYQVRYVLGVDMGATHLTAVVMDLQGEVVAQRYLRFAVMQDPEGTAAAIQHLIQQLLQEANLSPSILLGLGVAVPAPLEGENLRRLSHVILPAWQGYALAETLERATGLTVYLENDANAGVIAEQWWGRGRDFANLAYIKLGTGVGSGLIVRHEIYRGDGGTAGEIGHTTITTDGPICRCGNRGCLESYVGAPALIEEVNGQRQPNGQEAVQAIIDIVAAAEHNDPVSCQVIRKAGKFLGIAIANLINLFNPGLIVLGGELAAAGDLLLNTVHESVTQRAMPKAASEATITVSQLGDDAVAIGAATLVIHHAFQPSNLSTMLKG
ncbi:MAG: ROK family transcriptional regulator [Chloroflexi bacterium]|nr:ROK family transcriptional regulator [Chloroflexota bacterium]MBP8057540.1 ROK family transcriptional regulator [Chloroflexota bacterium]